MREAERHIKNLHGQKKRKNGDHTSAHALTEVMNSHISSLHWPMSAEHNSRGLGWMSRGVVCCQRRLTLRPFSDISCHTSLPGKHFSFSPGLQTLHHAVWLQRGSNRRPLTRVCVCVCSCVRVEQHLGIVGKLRLNHVFLLACGLTAVCLSIGYLHLLT